MTIGGMYHDQGLQLSSSESLRKSGTSRTSSSRTTSSLPAKATVLKKASACALLDTICSLVLRLTSDAVFSASVLSREYRYCRICFPLTRGFLMNKIVVDNFTTYGCVGSAHSPYGAKSIVVSTILFFMKMIKGLALAFTNSTVFKLSGGS